MLSYFKTLLHYCKNKIVAILWYTSFEIIIIILMRPNYIRPYNADIAAIGIEMRI